MFSKLLVADIKMLLRNKQALFWALAFPLVFATIFGLFRFDDIGEAQVAVVGAPAEVAPFELAFGQVEPIETVAEAKLDGPFDTEARARNGLLEGDLDMVLLVEGGSVRLLFDETQADRNAVFLPIVERVVDQLNLRAANITPHFALTREGIAGRDVQYYDFVLPGLVGMGVMTYGIIGLASTVAQYRAQRILRRITATPLKPRVFIGALVVAHLLLAIVQSSLILAWGVMLFGGSVAGNLLSVFVIVVLGNITFLNIGFMVASRAESAEAASGLGNAVSMPMMFFSGVFFPTAGLPWILPFLTSLLPLRPMVDAIRAITLDGTSITELGSQILQLAVWGVVTFLLASRIFRFERAAA